MHVFGALSWELGLLNLIFGLGTPSGYHPQIKLGEALRIRPSSLILFGGGGGCVRVDIFFKAKKIIGKLGWSLKLTSQAPILACRGPSFGIIGERQNWAPQSIIN
jgi:hypothetical protein